MGKQAAKKGGRDSGQGGKGGANKNNKTVDAAALGLGGTPPTPLANTSLLQPMANPSGVAPGLDPNMMSMLAMAQAFNGGQQQGQTMNVAFSQAQLLQVMQAVQANNAAQKAAEEAASKKTLEDAVAAATTEKDARIAALEGKKKKARTAADDENDEESDEEADEEDEEPLKLTKTQQKRARRKKVLADSVSSKQTLQAQLATARAEAELA